MERIVPASSLVACLAAGFLSFLVDRSGAQGEPGHGEAARGRYRGHGAAQRHDQRTAAPLLHASRAYGDALKPAAGLKAALADVNLAKG